MHTLYRDLDREGNLPLPSEFPAGEDLGRFRPVTISLRILAFLTEPDVVEGILRHLGLPHRPPRIAPARDPPQAEIDFDQTPPWDREASSSPPPLPQLDPFDQSLPGDDGTWSA